MIPRQCRLLLFPLLVFLLITSVNASSGDRLDIFIQCKADWYYDPLRRATNPVVSRHTAHLQTRTSQFTNLCLSIYVYYYGTVPPNATILVNDKSPIHSGRKVFRYTNSTGNGLSNAYGVSKSLVACYFPCSISMDTIEGHVWYCNESLIHSP